MQGMKQSEIEMKRKSIVEDIEETRENIRDGKFIDALFENCKYFNGKFVVNYEVVFIDNIVNIDATMKMNKEALDRIIFHIKNNKYDVKMVVIKNLQFSHAFGPSECQKAERDFYQVIEEALKFQTSVLKVSIISRDLESHFQKMGKSSIGLTPRIYVDQISDDDNKVDTLFENATVTRNIVKLDVSYRYVDRIKDHIICNWLLFKELHLDCFVVSSADPVKQMQNFVKRIENGFWKEGHTELTNIYIKDCRNQNFTDIRLCKIYYED
jgi:hypothetical protein